MRIGHNFNLALAVLVGLVYIQSTSFASAHGGLASGPVRFSSSHHSQIKQPPPPPPAQDPSVNVMQFGATGNGVTDDTAAIQNAIAYAQGAHEAVLFPAGTYLHNSIIYDNGVPLKGVGGGSVLLANNPTATAVVLTGVSPSIQNMVVNSGPASTVTLDTTPFHTTVLVQAAQNFVVQGITIVQGRGRVGVYVQQSAVGQVGAVTFFGTGSGQEIGIIVDGCSNTSLVGNLLQAEGTAITIGGFSNFVSSSIAVVANTISNANSAIVLNPTTSGAISTVILDIEQNQIQLVTTNAAVASLQVNNAADSFSIMRNTMSGGIFGMAVAIPSSATTGGVISQNIIRNCNEWGAAIATTAGGVIQFTSNQFGECGVLYPNSQVILAIAQGGPNSIILVDNIYQGHANNLINFIQGILFHINNVSGNTQTQTNLPNTIP